MTPAEFTEYWNKSDKPSLNKFRLTSPLASGLSSACVSALKEYGLPDAAGWLEFGETNDFSNCGNKRIIFVGRLDPQKGYQYLNVNSGINAQNPDYHRNYKIPDGMLNGLKNKLTECDPVAMAGKSYWYCEVSALDDSFATHLTAL